MTRGRSLIEKKYGPGIRPGLLRRVDAPWQGCAVENRWSHPCTSPVAGSIEMYVDAHDPGNDWYLALLRKLPVGAWVRVRFCLAHLEAAMQRSLQEQETPETWEPGRDNPKVLINPAQVAPWAKDAKGWE